jgi:hypothetical protein
MSLWLLECYQSPVLLLLFVSFQRRWFTSAKKRMKYIVNGAVSRMNFEHFTATYQCSQCGVLGTVDGAELSAELPPGWQKSFFNRPLCDACVRQRDEALKKILGENPLSD